jgi:hypothetical protein
MMAVDKPQLLCPAQGFPTGNQSFLFYVLLHADRPKHFDLPGKFQALQYLIVHAATFAKTYYEISFTAAVCSFRRKL